MATEKKIEACVASLPWRSGGGSRRTGDDPRPERACQTRSRVQQRANAHQPPPCSERKFVRALGRRKFFLKQRRKVRNRAEVYKYPDTLNIIIRYTTLGPGVFCRPQFRIMFHYVGEMAAAVIEQRRRTRPKRKPSCELRAEAQAAESEPAESPRRSCGPRRRERIADQPRAATSSGPTHNDGRAFRE